MVILAYKIVHIFILRFEFLRMRVFKTEMDLTVLAEIKLNYIRIIVEPVIQVRPTSWDSLALFKL